MRVAALIARKKEDLLASERNNAGIAPGMRCVVPPPRGTA